MWARRSFHACATCGWQPQRVDAGVVDLQVTPEQPAEVARDGAQGGVVEVGRALGEVLDQQIPDGPALRCRTRRRSARCCGDRPAAAPATVPAPLPGARRSSSAARRTAACPRCPGSGAPASAAVSSTQSPTVMSLTRPPLRITIQVILFRASDLAQPAASVGLGLKAAEAVGVDGRPGLGEHQRLALPQQPPVAGPDDLPGDQQHQPAAQLVAVMVTGRDTLPQRQIGPVEPGAVGPAGQPPFLPGVPGLALQPVQQLGQAAPPGLVPGAARARDGEQGQAAARSARPGAGGSATSSARMAAAPTSPGRLSRTRVALSIFATVLPGAATVIGSLRRRSGHRTASPAPPVGSRALAVRVAWPAPSAAARGGPGHGR